MKRREFLGWGVVLSGLLGLPPPAESARFSQAPLRVMDGSPAIQAQLFRIRRDRTGSLELQVNKYKLTRSWILRDWQRGAAGELEFLFRASEDNPHQSSWLRVIVPSARLAVVDQIGGAYPVIRSLTLRARPQREMLDIHDARLLNAALLNFKRGVN